MRPRRSRAAVGVVAVLCVGPALAAVSAPVVSAAPPATVVAPLPRHCVADLSVVSCTFDYNGTTGSNGSTQRFKVPSAVTRLTVEAWGAQGGTATTFEGPDVPAVGGLGGYAKGTVPVTAGEIVDVRVGGQPTGSSGGFNGGGAAGPAATGYFAEPGGGASDVRLGGGTLYDRAVVAGGGGGAASDQNVDHGGALGGAGGGSSGTTSYWCPTNGFLTTCGAGATAGAGGADGSSLTPCAKAGRLGHGGAGCGGGGGGGYFGGGGGGFEYGDCCGPDTTPIDGPGGGGSAYITASATAPSSLVGVQFGNGLVRLSYATATSHPGLRWSAARNIDGTTGGFTAVSCADSSFCVAVDGAGEAFTYDGHWSKAVPVVTGGLLAVSCASPTFCVAVGWPGPGIAVDSHGNWSTSSGPVDGVQGSLTGVSCVSVSFCVAAGTLQEQGPPGTTAFVQTFDGHSWTVILNQDLTGYGSGDFMQAVSCLSISFCLAGGTAGDRGDIGGLVDVDTAGTWTWNQISDDRMAPAFADQGGVNAVACGAVNSCVAAGPSGYVFSDDDNGWTQQIGDPVAPVTAVSCPDASTCLAVDSVGNVLVDQGGDWEVPQTVDPDHDITSLSCPTAQFCMAVDNTGDVLVGDT